ncbi:MAG: hypothetical protein II847_03370 [Ruminobacter sp.]|uniref:hypothetical protein n=1 Tax=Ruminobacter sp. TaxID=2774296 RepID=UPI0025807FEF|nr:hypothetical protein [Ruminobacter sp.]MBQ3775153.1 hypothetical protein [Ruminobacter sp.]
MIKEFEYIELDRYFMNHVICCFDQYQKKDVDYIEGLKDEFQKVIDIVKPVKTERACTDEEKKRYKLDYHKDLCNALDYEKCYTVLLDQVKDKTTDEKVDFLYPFVPYLRGILNISTAVDDNNEMYRFCSNQTIAYLMVYRYEHKISILEDLHFELSVKDVDIYDSALSKKLAQEEVDASLEFQRNHPEEYRRKNEERREFLRKMAERIKNNLLKYELSKEKNK